MRSKTIARIIYNNRNKEIIFLSKYHQTRIGFLHYGFVQKFGVTVNNILK